jgi:hypothetical protein
MPPCAVWTMTGTAKSALAHGSQHAHAVEPGITRSRMARRSPPARLFEQRASAASPLSTTRLVAEAAHRLEQAALHGIVVDDENCRCHGHRNRASIRRAWGICAFRINAHRVLNKRQKAA